ncbi:MAG: hypothetical protein PHT59_04435 [Candidatus Omnitrophica bacterium]|nr:hypothetical protein [Candidatus Omnitrophota bacterium]
MKKCLVITMLVTALSWTGQTARLCNAQSQAVNYLVETGITYYNNGAYNDALHEFKKVILVDPQNPVALEYLRKISGEHPTVEAPLPVRYAQPVSTQATSRELIIARTLDNLEQPKKEKQQQFYVYTPAYGPVFAPPAPVEQLYAPVEEPAGTGPFFVSGEVQASFGYEDDELIGKRANFDLNEKN